MLSYLGKYGIGDSTGIDLEGELAPGLKRNRIGIRLIWRPRDSGQGISVTPIELLDAFATIANKGQRMEPHVVSEITTPDGQQITIPPKVLDQPIAEGTAKVMTEILVHAVDEGEAKFARLAKDIE